MSNQLREKTSELEVRLKLISAESIMTKSVITTKPDADLSELANQVIKDRISGVPVIGKNGKIIGIITTTDLLIVMGMILEGSVEENGKPTFSPTVSFAMSSDVISVSKKSTLDEIVKTMRNKSIHTIPVMEDDKLVGVIGRHDVLKKFYEVVKSL